MCRPCLAQNERGIALVAVLLVALAVSALAIAATMITASSVIIRRQGERAAVLNSVALAGLEEARSALNGTRTLFPDSGFATLELGAVVVDAAGDPVAGVRRSVYVGPTGIISGQYGVFGSIVAVAEDSANNRVVRRLEINQESFAKYAYFTDVEPSSISFGGGDQIFGPVHTNDFLKIYASGATFWDEVRTARTVVGAQYGVFAKGYEENVPVIRLPDVADLVRLRTQATSGSMYLVGNTAGEPGEATLRIEFVAVDLDGDGNATGGDEGFIRVYRGNDPGFVVATRPPSGIGNSRNCGDTQGPHGGTFVPTANHPSSGGHAKAASLNDASARCYLGGDPVLTNGFQAATAEGGWIPWAGPVDARVAAARPGEAAYLWPITRALNPNFKGVIYVEGKVAVSGTVRGRVTLVASNSIIIADDVRQATDPGAGICDDILGLLAPQDVLVSNNTINAPVNVQGNAYKTMDPDGDRNEFLHAVVLALNTFTVENHDGGPTNRERCETTNWGRGCLYLTGGIIQRTRGAVGTSGGTGNLKRYSYNTCAYTDPPPYFPTTGPFSGTGCTTSTRQASTWRPGLPRTSQCRKPRPEEHRSPPADWPAGRLRQLKSVLLGLGRIELPTSRLSDRSRALARDDQC
jgi:hypothetical protein